MKVWTLLLLLAVGMVVSGCEEAQQQWGQGEPPADWQGFFGNSNLSRLNFVRTQATDRQAAIIYGINTRDPNGQAVHKAGLIERVMTLEEQVRKLEAKEYIESGEEVDMIGEEGFWHNETTVTISKVDPNS